MIVRPTLMLSCLLALSPLLPTEAAEWEKLPPLPEPNGGFMCGEDHGYIVVVGGTRWVDGEKKWLSAIHLFDPVRKQWKSAPSLDTPFAYGVGGTSKKGLVLGDALVFAGGSTGTTGFVSQAWLEGHGHLVLRQGLPADQAVVLAAGGMVGERLIFVGGTHDAAHAEGFRRTSLALDAQGNVEPLPAYPGKPFGTAGSGVVGESLFIFAGGNWDADTQAVVNTDEAYAFSMGSRSWKKLTPFPYLVRGLSAVTLNDGTLYVAGGYKNDAEGFTDEAFLYDPEKDEYRPAKPLPYKAMVGLVICDGYVYCLGGEDKQKSRTDACYRIAVADLLK